MVRRALHTKLARDLRRMPMQVGTIAFVVALGIASFIASLSTYRSLERSRDVYYATSRFADVFARVVSAPRRVASIIAALPGVADVDARVTATVRVEVPGFGAPARGVFTSMSRPGGLNELFLREGRLPARPHEVVVGGRFARAHDLHPGDVIHAVFDGRRVELRVVAIGMSPEYVWVIAPGSFWQDDLHHGVFFMRHDTLASALGLDDAFNDVALALAPGANTSDVLDAVDRVLAPYGAFGAVDRERQASNRLLDGEIEQLATMAFLLPTIFLGVAAFLLNVVLARIVRHQREQIAALRALGYSRVEVGLHYTMMALAILAVGGAMGLWLGAWGGQAFVSLYTAYFEMPSLEHHLDADLVAASLAVTAAAGLAGAFSSVWRVMALAPAEAMRPEPPARDRTSALEKAGAVRWLPVSWRMVLRDVVRQPLRLALSSLGIASATAILVAGNASFDAIDAFFGVQFDRVQRQDLEVSFARPIPAAAARSLASVPGVQRVEVRRLVPVRLRATHREREVVLRALGDDERLQPLLDRHGRDVHVPPRGVALSAALGDMLDAGLGDEIELEVLQDERRTRRVRITALVDDALGLSAYMGRDALREVLDEDPIADGALLTVDPSQRAAVERAIGALPEVTSVTRPETARAFFEAQFTDVLLVYQAFLVVCAAAIAVAVVSNNARVALASRARDLATLRILGFRRGEATAILVSEQAVQLALGVPLGLVLGRELARALYARMDPELYRIALVVQPSTYAIASIVVIGAALGSMVFLRRGVKRLDLVAVLKARD